MATDPNKKTFARLIKLHPGLVLAYLNPDGEKVAIYRELKQRRPKNQPPPRANYRYTVYGKNWKVVDTSHEGFRNLKHAIANASRPAPMPAVPELGNGILWTADVGIHYPLASPIEPSRQE